MCVRECVYVCFCSQLSHLISQPPQHTPVQRVARHTVVQAMKNVIDNVHVQYYIDADTEKTSRCLELATAIIKINYKVVKINLPATGNTHPPYRGIWSRTKFERQSKYSFHLFSGMCNRDGFQPKRKNVSIFMLLSNRGRVFYGFRITKLSKVVKNRCGKLRHSRIGSVVQINKRFS